MSKLSASNFLKKGYSLSERIIPKEDIAKKAEQSRAVQEKILSLKKIDSSALRTVIQL